jgi:hypothetical protein
VSWQYVSALRKAVKENRTLVANVSKRPGIFENVAIQAGSLSLDHFVRADLAALISGLFTRHGNPLPIGPETSVDWVLAAFSSQVRHRYDVAAAAQFLRMLAASIGLASHLPYNVPIPLVCFDLRPTDARIEVAAKRLYGYPEDCRDGFSYLVACIASLYDVGTEFGTAVANLLTNIPISAQARAVLLQWNERHDDLWISGDLGSG